MCKTDKGKEECVEEDDQEAIESVDEEEIIKTSRRTIGVKIIHSDDEDSGCSSRGNKGEKEIIIVEKDDESDVLVVQQH